MFTDDSLFVDDSFKTRKLTIEMIDLLTDTFSETNWIIDALPTDNYWSNATKKISFA